MRALPLDHDATPGRTLTPPFGHPSPVGRGAGGEGERAASRVRSLSPVTCHLSPSVRGFTYTELLCILGIIACMWALLLPAAVGARNRADETVCALRLHHVSLALRMYAQDHYGWLPAEQDGLRALTPRYLNDPEVLRCPTVLARERRWAPALRLEPPGSVDYAYRSGLAIDDLPDHPVAWDNASRHRDGVNMLYLSGRVEHSDDRQVLGPPAGARGGPGVQR